MRVLQVGNFADWAPHSTENDRATNAKRRRVAGLVYSLADPRTMEIRYVGITTRTLPAHLQQHMKEAIRPRRKSYRTNWIRGLSDCGLSPVANVLEVGDDVFALERAWIAYFKRIGIALVNMTTGGDGLVEPAAETRDKIRRYRLSLSPEERKAAATKASRGMSTEERRQQCSQAIRAWWAGQSKEERAAAMRQRNAARSPEKRKAVGRIAAAASQAMRGTERGRVAEERTLAAIAEYWKDPQNRAKESARRSAMQRNRHSRRLAEKMMGQRSLFLEGEVA